MFGHVYYHATIRKYVALFGTLFNEIYINRTDDAGNETQMRVPITYGPKEKVLVRTEQDPNLNKPFAIVLPFMSFEMHGMSYDASRKMNTLGRIHGIDSANKNQSKNVYMPVPYSFAFSLNIMAKNLEDGTKILEQILPFFTPEWTTTIKVIDEPEILLDVPVVLNSVNPFDTWEGNFESRRYIVWTLSFTLKGQLYGPMERSKIIKVAKTNINYTAEAFGNTIPTNYNSEARVTVYPGMLANGSPTENASLTVPYSDIDWNDNYGFVTEQELFV